MEEPPYGLRVFRNTAPGAGVGRILLTGGGNGKGVGRPGVVNRLEILNYKTDCKFCNACGWFLSFFLSFFLVLVFFCGGSVLI